MNSLVPHVAIVSLAALLYACGGGGGGGSAVTNTTASSGAGTATATDVLTYHNDTLRTGQNLRETVLTPANVTSSSFGLLHVLSVDGAVDATPLVATKVTINGASHNVVYVATENDTVYAFDADSYQQLLSVSLLNAGETVVDHGACPDVAPIIGITATPVIDRSAGPNGTLFVVAMSQDTNGTASQRLHALDLASLAERPNSPVAIQATAQGSSPNGNNGTLTFQPGQYKERSALLLSGGQIYTGWASHCDVLPYNGWIIAYNESTLAQTQVLNLTPNGIRGAVWNVGGLLADTNGSLFAVVANGTFDSQNDYGNAAVRLTNSGNSLTVADYFAPSDSADATANDADDDFGSGSPVGIADQVDTSGKTRQLMFTATKRGNVFVLDRSNLGRFNADANQSYQQLGSMSGGFYSAPAYYNGSIYAGGVGQPLIAYTLNKAVLPNNPSSQTAVTFAYPGAFPTISANGASNGIVWAVESNPGSPAVLHAFNPANLAVEYYNSTQAANNRDSFGNGNKFVTPVIANGKVFVATPSGVAVFGPL